METIIYSLAFITFIEIFSFSLLPCTSIIFRYLPDRGYAVSKVIGIFISAYIVWILVSLHFFAFTRQLTLTVSLIVIVPSLLIYLVYYKFKSRIFNYIKSILAPDRVDTQSGKQTRNLWRYSIHLITNIFLSIPEKETKEISNKLITNKNTKNYKFITLIEEFLFLGTFFIWVFIRGINPDIIGTEKFMDLGIVNALLKSNYFPPHDLWLSGHTLNYYYYGQYIFAFLTKLSNIPSYYTYNFAIALIFALSFILTFSVIVNLSEKIYAGLISAFILTLGGNIHFFVTILNYFRIHNSLKDFNFWYPASTRLIPYTINEFPLYSFIVADLHAHVIDIIAVLFFLIICINILIKKSINLADMILASFIVGMIAVTNSWDALIYSSILFMTVSYITLIKKNHNRDNTGKIISSNNSARSNWTEAFINNYIIPVFSVGIGVIFTGLLGIFFFLPYYLTFKAPVDGIGINLNVHSDPAIVFMLFGFFFFFILSFAIFLGYSILTKKKTLSTDSFMLYLIIIGIFLIAASEVVYLKDIFYKANPPYFRANTVFKLYYQAWILFAISVGYIILRINSIFKLKNIRILPKILTSLWNMLALISIVIIFLYTYEALNQGYFNFTNVISDYTTQSCVFNICYASFKTDDGINYIKQQHYDDYQIIQWLNTNAANNSVICEAVGDSYTYFGRISANTGLTTVLGWPNHEFQWRNTYTYSSERTTDVSNLYTSANILTTQSIVNKYNINYIIVGTQERTKYTSINENTLKQVGSIIFQSGSSYIIKIK